jgi:hypothetical protein
MWIKPYDPWIQPKYNLTFGLYRYHRITPDMPKLTIFPPILESSVVRVSDTIIKIVIIIEIIVYITAPIQAHLLPFKKNQLTIMPAIP